jgi:hypothetical protein
MQRDKFSVKLFDSESIAMMHNAHKIPDLPSLCAWLLWQRKIFARPISHPAQFNTQWILHKRDKN